MNKGWNPQSSNLVSFSPFYLPWSLLFPSPRSIVRDFIQCTSRTKIDKGWEHVLVLICLQVPIKCTCSVEKWPGRTSAIDTYTETHTYTHVDSLQNIYTHSLNHMQVFPYKCAWKQNPKHVTKNQRKQTSVTIHKSLVIYSDTLSYRVQLVGAVRNTDCIFAEGYGAPKRILDMTLNDMMLRFQHWSFEECTRSFYCHYSKVHSEPEW